MNISMRTGGIALAIAAVLLIMIAFGFSRQRAECDLNIARAKVAVFEQFDKADTFIGLPTAKLIEVWGPPTMQWDEEGEHCICWDVAVEYPVAMWFGIRRQWVACSKDDKVTKTYIRGID